MSIDKDAFLCIIGAHDEEKELARSELLEIFGVIDIDGRGRSSF